MKQPQLTLVTRSSKTCIMAATLLSDMEGHAVVLQEAFASLTGRAGGLQVQTKEGTLVTLNRDLLLLFSPVLRGLLSSSSLTDCLLVLPGISLTALLALAALLTRGKSRHPATAAEVTEAASCLGIKMNDLAIPLDFDTNSESSTNDQQVEEEVKRKERKRNEEKLKEKETRKALEHKKELERERERKIREEAAKAKEVEVKGIKRKSPENNSGVVEPQDAPSMVKRPAVARPATLHCLVKDAKCTEQGKIFDSAYNLRYHYAKHARAALITRLKQFWPNSINNNTNTCESCQVIFQNRDMLVFHIGAKHKEVDAILTRKGIPIPQEESVALQPQVLVSTLGNHAPSSEPVDAPAVAISGTDHASPSPLSTNNVSGQHEQIPENLQQNLAASKSSDKELVNYELECQVCENTCSTLSQLHQHCTNHFIRNIQTKFSHLIAETGKQCLVCGYMAKSKSQVVTHLGCKHGKVNDILQEMGFKSLPCPVAPNTQKDKEIQKKLVELKKERHQGLGDMVEEQRVDVVDNHTTSLSPESFINIRKDIFNHNSSGPIQNEASKSPSGRRVSFGPDEIRYVPSIKRF